MVQFLDPKTAKILQFLDPEIIEMDKKILDPEILEMVQFLNPEIAEILQFLDPEIVKMDKKNSGSRNCRNGAISGSRNRRKGRQILFEKIVQEGPRHQPSKFSQNQASNS